MKQYLLLGIALAFTGAQAADPPKKSRDEMVLDDRAALASKEGWIYNDLEEAFSEAERSGKPLMVIHRCIP